MSKDIAHPVPSPLYRLQHPALRQVGCPICKTPNTTLELHKTVVMKGPVKHEELGPVAGNVFSVIGKCEAGHHFILRIANHRDSVLVWTDVVIDENTHHVAHPAPLDQKMMQGDPTGVKLDKEESSGLGQYPTYQDMQKHQPPPVPLGQAGDHRCHAGQPVMELLRVLEEEGYATAVCLQCPNAVCPVNQTLLRHASIRAHNVNACVGANSGPPKKPHEKFMPQAKEAMEAFEKEINDPKLLSPEEAAIMKQQYEEFKTMSAQMQNQAKPKKGSLMSVFKKEEEEALSRLRAKFRALAYPKRYKLSNGDQAKLIQELRRVIGSTAGRRAMKMPKIHYAAHAFATLADMLNDCKIPTPAKKRIADMLVPSGLNITPDFLLGHEQPTPKPVLKAPLPPKKVLAPSAAKVVPPDENSHVQGCPDKLTIKQARSEKCQKLFCKGCDKSGCPMHPTNNPKIP